MKKTDLVTTYLLERGEHFFPGWTLEALEDYVDFHLNQGTMTVAIVEGKIAGLLIGWQQDSDQQEKWAWQPTNPKGQFWWWEHFFAECPQVAMALAETMIDAWPQSAWLPSAAIRNGKLKKYKPGTALEIFRKALELYGRN